VSRSPDKLHIFISKMLISSPNPMFDHLFTSFHRDDFNNWSIIGFGEEITQVKLLKFILCTLSGALVTYCSNKCCPGICTRFYGLWFVRGFSYVNNISFLLQIQLIVNEGRPQYTFLLFPNQAQILLDHFNVLDKHWGEISTGFDNRWRISP